MPQLLENVPLAPRTTLGIGGSARYWLPVTDVADIAAAVDFAADKQLPVRVLGGGSNLLVSDAGVDAVVLQMQVRGRTHEIAGDTILFTCGAGEVFDECVSHAVAAGWWGLENLSHIPGTVGATPIQNVGAYGVDVSQCIESVTVVDTQTKKVQMISNQDCAFGYRTSRFKTTDAGRYIVTAVTFRLSRTPRPQVTYADFASLATGATSTLRQIREHVIAVRSKKFPDWSVIGTAGSFFKNPTVAADVADALVVRYPELPVYAAAEGQKKVSLGYILDKVCGLRGFEKDGVGLYQAQALVLTAARGVTAKVVVTFAEYVAAVVKEKTAIDIEWEVQRW